MIRTAVFLGALTLVTTAQAALHDRGGGLIYDDDLNITWLQDANLAASNTFGIQGATNSAYGDMSWYTAQDWIAAMNASHYLGYNDWRLPKTVPVNGTAYNYAVSYNGTTDWGYNISAPDTAYAGSTGSELAYLFYNELGNKGLCAPSSSASTCQMQASGVTLTNIGPFKNLQTNGYWSATEYAPDNYKVWGFDFGYGPQGSTTKNSPGVFAWAVRDGDVASIPEPETYGMFLAGLGLMGLVKRRRTGN